MTWEALFTLGVVAAIIVALVRDVVPPAAAMVGGMVAVMVAGVVSPEAALAGFANPAPVTIAALYVVARAIEKTGALTPLMSRMLGDDRSERVSLTRLVAPTTAVSGLINNTPIVAMLIPQVEAWARMRRLPASAVLMPLSFAAILGGVLSLTGTATNIVVSGLLEDAGAEPLAFFELAWVGLPIAALGGTILVLSAPRLLPRRLSAQEQSTQEWREFVVDMRVTPGGPVDGRTVEHAGLRHLEGVFLVQIEREGDVMSTIGPATTLHGGDLVRFVGKAGVVVDLHARPGLEQPVSVAAAEMAPGQAAFFEAVVGAESPLVGQTVREAEFRGRYQAAVIAVHRAGQRIDAKIGDVRIRVGDTLLLLADPHFKRRWHDRNDFLVISPLAAAPPVTGSKARYVALIGLGAIAATAGGVLPLVSAALLGAVLMVLVGAVRPGEARAAVDLDVIITIAAAFSLSAAMGESGLADGIAEVVVAWFGALGPVAVLAAVTVLTFFMTEVITSKAAVLLLVPVAFSAATAVGADLRPFAIAVAVAGALGFLSPVGYPTNTMVYGPGGYRVADYVRLGLPLTVTVLVCIVVIVPLVWPL